MPIISYHPPSRGREMPEGQWVGRRRKRAKPTSGATRHLLPEEGGRMPPFLHRHFERKREIFFVRGQAKVVREAGNGKHRMLHVTGDHGASCRWIYEGKQQTANEKDPSAALGMTKRGNASRPFLFNPEQKPTSGATRHLLPEEGGRSGKKPSTPFPWKGARRRMRAGLSGIVILYLMRCFIPMRCTMPLHLQRLPPDPRFFQRSPL